MRQFLPFALLLCSLPVGAEIASAQVPIRPLLSELAQAKEGTAATIHTHFSIGAGLFLGSDKLVAARHNVLTPGGKIADEIGVGFAQLPLNNIVESRSTAIAQDPNHDLVLLRIVSGAPAPQAVRERMQAPAPCESARPVRSTRRVQQVRVSSPSPAPAMARGVRQRDFPSETAGERSPVLRPTLAREPLSVAHPHAHATAHAPLHIVLDGPLVPVRMPSRAAAHEQLTTASRTQLHVVWDGPLNHAR
jgi:hypothetical protein